MQDLPQLKDIYKQIVKNMNEQNIKFGMTFILVNFLRKI